LSKDASKTSVNIIHTYVTDQLNNFVQRLKLSENTFHSLLSAFDDFQALIEHVSSTRTKSAVGIGRSTTLGNKTSAQLFEYKSSSNDAVVYDTNKFSPSDYEQSLSNTMEGLFDLETRITPSEIVMMVKNELEKHKMTMNDFATNILG
jgi:hypothetical protein